MKKNRFFVLPYSIHAKHIPSLLGRIVLDPLDPNRRFTPVDSLSNGPQILIPSILEEPIPYKSYADIIQSASSVSLRAVLTSYFSLCVSSSRDSSVTLESAEVLRYQMIQNKVKFDTLMKDPGYADGVRTLLRESKRGDIYMIVGFLTTKATNWNMGQGGNRLLSARGTVPVGAASGASSELDVGAEVQLGNTVQQSSSGRVEQEEVFAVAYDKVYNKHSFDVSASRFMSSTPVLGDEKRATGGHLALAGADEDDSDQEVDYGEDPIDDMGIDTEGVPFEAPDFLDG